MPASSRLPPLTPAQKALARERTYQLLSQLYLHGLTPDVRPIVASIPALQAKLPPQLAADSAAADHYQVFSLNIFPNQSIFLDSSGLLGGEQTSRVVQSYIKSGFRVAPEHSNHDHIGTLLGCLAFLCGAESEAWDDGQAEIAGDMQLLQADLLRQHLLRWLMPLVVAVRWQQQPFFAEVASLTQGFVTDHVAELSQQSDWPLPDFQLPASPLPQQAGTISLRGLAVHLTTPPFSGLFLSRDHIGRLARQLRLPRGFGSRRQLLANLLEAAEQYEQMPALLQALQALLAEAASAYLAAGQALPVLLPYSQPWAGRANETARLLLAWETA